jgi:nickel-dependent lactate racemase
MEIAIKANGTTISDEQLFTALQQSLSGRKLSRVLLLPPDITRLHSYAGKITAFYYQLLKGSCQVDIMPAIGTHDAMTREECREFFGPDIPFEALVVHRWKDDVANLGQVPGEFVRRASAGLLDYPIDVEVNRRLLDPAYDLILSIGQVVPHEVVGMANYSKNIFVGCGGRNMINRTHFLGAVSGLETLMGHDHSPVRQVFDYAEENFIAQLPIQYVLTVTTTEAGKVRLHGLFIGRNRRLFEQAVELSQQLNLIFLDQAPKKVVAYLDAMEFKSTWIGNKAIYRSRLAIADGGELLILAPGVRKFGEDLVIDQLIRKYGYVGRIKVLEQYKANLDLQENLCAAAHLIHGSSDGRFRITYAVDKMSQAEIEAVGFSYLPLAEAVARYNPARLHDGYNPLPDGEEVFYISNPAVGLWTDHQRFQADFPPVRR